MATTTIEWTRGDDGTAGVTWNPTTGCDRISPGCDHCYALSMAKRLKAMGSSKYQTDGDPRTSVPGFGVAFHRTVLTEPLRWRKPRRVFVNSMSDIAHARITDVEIAAVFAVMALAPRHQFQVLTKRPKRLATLLSRPDFRSMMADAAPLLDDGNGGDSADDWVRHNAVWPLANVWLGTSIEADDYTWRADELRTAPAAVRFLSCEPLLGPLPSLNLTGIDWVIAGGESGPGCRDLDLDWVRDLRDRAHAQSVPFFLKQIGGVRPKAGGRLLDGRTWDEFPTPREVRA